ncbi:MAG: hypothetical protein BIFFINMI_02608 [Phycisphaerae bacterium]|nr:hypothetical protein [Phycisphaerae bacterium]
MPHWSRQVEPREPPDVLVAGGGMAGFSAAVAAARSGARVLLVEQYADLGGTATTCGVGAFCGETVGQGEVFDDVIAALDRLGAVQDYAPYACREFRKFDHELLKFVLADLAHAACVELLLHARVVDATRSGRRIDQVLLHTAAGLSAVAPRVVIDCTGNAALAHAAGLETLKGRPGDGLQLPMSLMFFIRDVGRPVAPMLPAGCRRYADKSELPMLSLWKEGDGKIGCKLKVIGFDSTDADGFSDSEIAARREMMSVLEFLQRTSHPTYKLDYVATQIGVREGRRVVGDYVLTEADLRAGRRFDDGIALGCFYLDAHSPTDTANVYQTEDRHVPPYHVPLRSLRPRGTDNVLVAGRCLSADQMALSSARVMTTASMMGQAAGLAAATAADAGIALNALDIPRLRADLSARGAVLDA